jgi:hypothetical protein
MNLKDLLFIHLPNFTHLNEPIQIVFCNSNTSVETVSFPRLLIDIGENCTASIHQICISYTQNITSPAKKPPKEFQFTLRSDRILGDLDNPEDQAPFEYDESLVPRKYYEYDENNISAVVGERFLEFIEPTGYFINSTILKDSHEADNADTNVNDENTSTSALETMTTPADVEVTKVVGERKYFVGGITHARVGRSSHLQHMYFQNYARKKITTYNGIKFMCSLFRRYMWIRSCSGRCYG